MGTLIDRADSRGFGVTKREGTGSSLAMNKGEGQVEVVLVDAEGAEHDTD